MIDYSHESPSEQMIEFLNSMDIKNEVIDKFDLYKHYFNLPGNGKPSYDKLYHEYDRKVIITPTFFRAVELDVTDISSDTAYEMINTILDILNKKLLQVQKEKAVEVADMWKHQLDLKQHQIDSMSNISKQLSKQYGLLIYNNQSKEISKAFYQTLAARKGSKQSDEIIQQMKNFEDHGIEFSIINSQIEAAVNDENTLGTSYANAMKDVNKHFTYWNMVSAPYKSDSPCYPSRLLIVLCACIGTFIFSVVFIRSTEKIRLYFSTS
jgi:capsule polysaccharide export protein KpsE/RkpR